VDVVFQNAFTTLDQAREAVGYELLQESLELDRGTLQQLLTATRSFAEQADVLAVMMLEAHQDEGEVAMVDHLVDFFRAIEQRIAVLLKAGRG
jgi:hypothetical protein